MKNDNELIISINDFKLIKSFYPEFARKAGVQTNKFIIGWSELMPVVEKIGKTELPNGRYKFVDFNICTNDGTGWLFWLKNVPGDQNQPQAYKQNGSLIEKTYYAVVEFIKWYNENKR